MPPSEKSNCDVRPPLASVVIPAHDEAEVIQRCLDALFTGIQPGELDVVVACNGCRDDTALLARSSGYQLRVLELSSASKPAALRAGDREALTFPRLYLDADVVLHGSSVRKLAERLNAGATAARPPIRYDSSRSSGPVRRYYRARSRMPAVLNSLWGAGVYGLSAAGRNRFDVFPDVVADDLWLEHQFEPGEAEIVDCAPVVVNVPRRSRDLVHMLLRSYKGKAENRSRSGTEYEARETIPSTLHDLARVAASGRTGPIDAATYAVFATGARVALAVGPTVGTAIGAERWERDNSSRTA